MKPLGSGDDFVKNIDIGNNLHGYFDTIVNGNIKSIDLGLCNDRKFLNGIGIGFDGQIQANMLTKKVPLLTGHAKYYFHVLHILSSYRARDYTLKIEGNESRQKLILLTIAKGTTFGGGFKLTPHGSIDDGQLAVCSIGDISPLKRYLNILKLQNGTHDSMNEVSLFHTREIEIAANDLLEGHIDGEYLGKPPFKISVMPKALRVRIRS
jgi:YegS/Rv2252/BmrU family lipid kinase